MNPMTLEYKTEISMDDALDIDMQIFRAIKEYRLQSLGQLAIDVVVDRLNIEPFYEFMLDFNAGNNHPYHNLYHSTCVMLNAYEGAWSTIDHSIDYDEVQEDIRGLCVGALMHDFNHSGGHLSDEENIKHAQQGLRIAQSYANSKLLGLSPRSLAVAESVIKVTQYPFIHEPISFYEQIIRDADLMMPYEEDPDALQKQYIGLKNEIEIQKGEFTPQNFAVGVKKFLSMEVKWHTEWAATKAEIRNWEMIKSKLCKLLGGEYE
jgi:hypothetical protein